MESGGRPERLETNDTEAVSFCPSFNSYTSDRFAEIAAVVTEEHSRYGKSSTDDGDDFEFAFVRDDLDVTADDISCDGQFRQIFPVFNRDILIPDDLDQDRGGKPDISTSRLPLAKLFTEDREERDPPSSSSSEADELESVPPGTYCVWRPKALEASPSTCKKSNSTGSASKRWKIRDLLRRSNSDGKDSFVFLTPKNKEQKAAKSEVVESPKERRNSGEKAKSKRVAGGEKATSSTSAHEVFYIRSRASKEGDKRKSYLPYRQDLFGFFASVNGGAGKAFPPF